jgi:hypothetical protein
MRCGGIRRRNEVLQVVDNRAKLAGELAQAAHIGPIRIERNTGERGDELLPVVIPGQRSIVRPAAPGPRELDPPKWRVAAS